MITIAFRVMTENIYKLSNGYKNVLLLNLSVIFMQKQI